MKKLLLVMFLGLSIMLPVKNSNAGIITMGTFVGVAIGACDGDGGCIWGSGAAAFAGLMVTTAGIFEIVGHKLVPGIVLIVMAEDSSNRFQALIEEKYPFIQSEDEKNLLLSLIEDASLNQKSDQKGEDSIEVIRVQPDLARKVVSMLDVTEIQKENIIADLTL